MKETLNQLIKLQGIDCRLQEINELKGNLPETVLEQEKILENFKSDNSSNESRLNEIEISSRKLMGQVEDENSKLKKYKDQLYLVTSNKEYDALNNEIDNTKSSILQKEEIILKDEEEKNTLNDQTKSNLNHIEDLIKKLDDNKVELDTALSQTKDEEKKLQKSRVNLVQNVDLRYLNSYERLMAARDGAGMVSMIKSACGSCYSKMPPQFVIEVKSNSKIISCPSCNIFLFWDGTEE